MASQDSLLDFSPLQALLQWPSLLGLHWAESAVMWEDAREASALPVLWRPCLPGCRSWLIHLSVPVSHKRFLPRGKLEEITCRRSCVFHFPCALKAFMGTLGSFTRVKWITTVFWLKCEILWMKKLPKSFLVAFSILLAFTFKLQEFLSAVSLSWPVRYSKIPVKKSQWKHRAAH